MKCSQVMLSSASDTCCMLEQLGDMLKVNMQSSVLVPQKELMTGTLEWPVSS